MHRSKGFTLVELLLALAIAVVIVGAMAGVLGQTLETQKMVRDKNALYQEARFAMQRMVNAVGGTRLLLIPLGENPATAWPESVREYPPRAAFPNETAVLAVTLDPTLDHDQDGWADANNDKDFLDINGNTIRDAGEPERIDEDWPKDTNNDGKQGVRGIDDNNNGAVDDGGGGKNDDDEDGLDREDPVDGKDNDGDGSVDEDPGSDMNQDGFAGTGGTGKKNDDDEDGKSNEDWLDSVVFFQSGDKNLCSSSSCLVERAPNLNPKDGKDYSERSIAENVSVFRLERLPNGVKRAVVVTISLELTNAAGESVSFSTRVRAGGSQ